MGDNPRTTKKVRMHIDLELATPHSAEQLYALAKDIETTVTPQLGVEMAKVTEIIPAEHNFDWQGR